MKDVTKVKLAATLAAASFWIAVAVFFLQSKGLALAEIYQLTAIYYLGIVIFEFPTGVIGDYFSHRLSVVSGHFLLALVMMLWPFGGDFMYYFWLLVAAALGVALFSGSDTALLHSASHDFKKDYSQMKLGITLSTAIATACGSILILINPYAPFIMTGLCSLAAALLVLSVKNDTSSREGNIFQTGLASLKHVWQNRILLHLLILSGSTLGFMYSLKWFYNPLLEQMGVPLAFWGILISATLFMPIVGIKIYQKSSRLHIAIAFGLFLLLMMPMGITQMAAIALGALYLQGMLVGYLDTLLDVRLNEAILINQRAGVLSLKNLFLRLTAAAYMPLAAALLYDNNFLFLFGATAGILALVCGYSLYQATRIASKRPVRKTVRSR